MHCLTQTKPVSNLWIQKNRINVNPPYQRETGIWNIEKKQLFVDSILNRFDVPKLYFHDLSGEQGPFLYSVIDGKQRLSAIWEFIEGQYPLADDFTFTSWFDGDNPPEKGKYFHEFTEQQKDYFKSQSIDIVHVQNAEDDDIEELFSRLNNGEPLNAAEKRNAMRGDMINMVRTVVRNEFFSDKLGFKNKRMSHDEVAAKIVRLELCDMEGSGVFCDLKKKFLDDMVKKHRTMNAASQTGLQTRIDKRLKELDKIFSSKDPLLGKQSYPQLYYGWWKQVQAEYAAQNLAGIIRPFLETFHAKRIENLSRAEEEDRDSTLIEYGRLMQQGTNDLNSMEERARILTRHLLLEHPELEIRDQSRSFSPDERYAIWIKAGKQCQGCSTHLSHVDDMEADHVKAWSIGGRTVLGNAQALCVTCNKKKGATVGGAVA